MKTNFNIEEVSILFRGLFVVFFLLIISFTKDEGKHDVEKVND